MPKDNNKIRIKIVTVVLFIVFIILSSKVWLSFPASFLLAKDNIKKADCIVPLGGDIALRFKKAVELYNQGLSDKIIVSVLPDLSDADKEYCAFKMHVYGAKEVDRKDFVLMAFRYLGKDSKGVLFTDQTVTSTYEEALATKVFMLKNGFKSLILVTTGYHSRRALMLFKTVLRGTGIKIYNITADRESLIPAKWWAKEDEVKDVLQEYLSIVHNTIYHLILNKKRTAFDTF